MNYENSTMNMNIKGLMLTLGFDPHYLLIEGVHVFLQLSFLLLHILEGLCQGLDFSFTLETDSKMKKT